ncbi:MAG: helix-turn-helix domain-containing protein [Flavobacteriales bacterium]|jgi:transcriptional regulator with XRE-family HTH domain|nr:helix-turn-helix domain-containing protein [Flavobacteriales bacterium]
MDWQNSSHEQIYRKIGEQLKLMRKVYGFSQEQLAEETGLGRTTIIRIEKGEVITLDSIIRIFSVFSILERFDQLFTAPELSPMQLFFKSKKK